jgi:hypothetical protein
LWWVTGGTLLLLTATLVIPFLHGLFRFNYFEAKDLALCLFAGVASVAGVEILKLRMFSWLMGRSGR